MSSIPNAQLTHLGLFVHDLEVMVAFYTKLMGLVVSDSGEFMGKELAFLTRSIDEHHQLVMIKGRTGEPTTKILGQISFRVDGLDELRYFAARAFALGATDGEARNHGNSYSIYFRDPEYNFVEMYVPTAWQVRQPWRVALDLSLSNEQIDAVTMQLIDEAGIWQPVSDWQIEIGAKITAHSLGEDKS